MLTNLVYIAVLLAILILLLTMLGFRPGASKEISPGLYIVLSGFSNLYLLETSEGLVAFDSGLNSWLTSRGLRSLHLNGDKVQAVFLTHSDFDHVSGLAAFPNAKVYLSAAEVQMIDGRTARRGFARNSLSRAYSVLQDGEVVQIGSSKVCLHIAPGHTPGSAVYEVNGHILVSGDLLTIGRSGEILPFTVLMNMNHRQNIQTLAELKPLVDRAEYVLSGHSGYRHHLIM